MHRETLYAEVWTEPVLVVAKRYGVSNVALAKACRKLSVPLPPYDPLSVRRLKRWHIRVPDFKVQVLGFGAGFLGILTGPSGSAKVAV